MPKPVIIGGSLNVRPFPPDLHHRCIIKAARLKKTLRLFVIECLTEKTADVKIEPEKLAKNRHA